MFLPTRRRFTGAMLRRGCVPPWHCWRRDAVARAERTADGHVHLVVLRARPGGIALSLTGVRADQAETLAPVAARTRRALSAWNGRLRGTSAFEDAVSSILDELGVPPRTRRAIVRLGVRCPSAPRLRTMPEPERLLACPASALARALGSRPLADRLQALARAFAARAPCGPRRA
jgi:hypothetical protein